MMTGFVFLGGLLHLMLFQTYMLWEEPNLPCVSLNVHSISSLNSVWDYNKCVPMQSVLKRVCQKSPDGLLFQVEFSGRFCDNYAIDRGSNVSVLKKKKNRLDYIKDRLDYIKLD